MDYGSHVCSHWACCTGMLSCAKHTYQAPLIMVFVIHTTGRDIKPENIFLNIHGHIQVGEWPRACLKNS